MSNKKIRNKKTLVDKAKTLLKKKRVDSITVKLPFVNVSIKENKDNETSQSLTKRVIYIDDDVHHCSRDIELLKEKGYLVYPVICAEDALNKIKSSKYDVIILDIMMPPLKRNNKRLTSSYRTGIHLLKEIKKSQNKEVPVIVVTGIVEYSDIQEIQELGVFCFFHKPVHPRDLIEKIDEALGLTSA